MNTTAANVLKILSQTEMSIEDMHLYLKVEKNVSVNLKFIETVPILWGIIVIRPTNIPPKKGAVFNYVY